MKALINWHLWLAFILCCALPVQVALQSVERITPIFVDGSNNETTKAEFDQLAERAGVGKLIILIARLGSGESTANLSRERLQAVRVYMKTVRAIPEERIIIAEGERVNGLGRVEAYLDGKLFMVFTLPRKRQFAGED